MSCNKFDFSDRNCSEVDIGLDWIKTFNYTDNTNLAIDLTGYSFSMRIREKKDDPDILSLGIVLDSSSTGFYIEDPTTGIIRLKITDTDTSSITSGIYKYDIIMTDSVGDKSIFMEGDILFSEGAI